MKSNFNYVVDSARKAYGANAGLLGLGLLLRGTSFYARKNFDSTCRPEITDLVNKVLAHNPRVKRIDVFLGYEVPTGKVIIGTSNELPSKSKKQKHIRVLGSFTIAMRRSYQVKPRTVAAGRSMTTSVAEGLCTGSFLRKISKGNNIALSSFIKNL